MSEAGIYQQSDEERDKYETEAKNIVNAAGKQGLTLRLLGSLAFQVHCPEKGHIQKELGRAYTDIDFAGYGSQSSSMGDFFTSQGYKGEEEVNLYFAGQRMIFNHPEKRIHVDIFFDKLDFCHEIRWAGRLEKDSPTLPLAEMLMEKMQIVKINEKDIIDTIMLLLEHPLGDRDQETINIQLISELCSKDWGLWRTLTMNLKKVADLAQHYQQLSEEEKAFVSTQVNHALEAMEVQPKSFNWKLRARLGDKVKWYKEVEEVS
jgi:hypothetical protein